MRLKFVLNAPIQLKVWSCFTCGCLCVKGFPSVIVIAGKGVSQVAGWLTVQWSFVVTSWALADEWSESVAS